MLEVIYLDDTVVCVNKPAGLFVHRSWLDRQATDFLLQQLRDQIGHYLYPVHRLDRPTSGVMIFALTAEAATALKEQFDAGEIEKTYLAVVRGWVEDREIDYSLSVIYDKVADRDARRDKPAQSAITRVKMLATVELPFASGTRYSTSRYSLLQLQPKTGRKHQLRRHMKHISHPIVGDTAYGDLRQNKAFAKHLGISRLMLHAEIIRWQHPVSGQQIISQATPDMDWQNLPTALAQPIFLRSIRRI